MADAFLLLPAEDLLLDDAESFESLMERFAAIAERANRGDQA
jgi:hypothetical protein